jgi:hypothetical protein
MTRLKIGVDPTSARGPAADAIGMNVISIDVTMIARVTDIPANHTLLLTERGEPR